MLTVIIVILALIGIGTLLGGDGCLESLFNGCGCVSMGVILLIGFLAYTFLS